MSGSDLLTYWKLNERPFEATWDTRFFFKSPAHSEAIERLMFLVTEQSMHMGLLTGEIGCGKTLLRAIFHKEIEDAGNFEVIIEENSAFPFEDLLGSALRQLEAEAPGDERSKIARFERLRAVAGEIYENGGHLVLVFDEAQEMTLETLNDLKLLTNLNGDAQNFLTVILVGQPELQLKILKQPAINQRISLRYHLAALSLEESDEYIRHRLRVAGHPSGELFTPGGIESAYRGSGGIPRELNRIAKLALELAFAKQSKAVTRTVVSAVLHDLEQQQNLRAA